jgi:hypothetical protein
MGTTSTSTISKISNYHYNLQFNCNRILALFFFYIYGIYGFNRINPIWENIDGKIFYIGSQTIMHLSIILVFVYQIKFLANEKEKKINFVLNGLQITYFIVFTAFYIIINREALKIDLYGDETSYAKYAYFHFEKIVNFAVSQNENLQKLELDSLIQFAGLITSVASIITIVILMKVKTKFFYLILITLTIIFRFLNLQFFEFENENPLPFLVIYQSFLSLFGLDSIVFRLGTIFIFVVFSVALLNQVNKLLGNTFVSFIATFAFLSTPIILTMSTKLDHAMFTFFSYSFILLWWLNGWARPILDRKIFIIGSIYLSFTNFMVLLILALVLILENYKYHKISRNRIKLSSVSILIYALPFITIHFFRILKSFHITNQLASEESPTFIDRISQTWDGILSFTDPHTLIFILIGLIWFVFFRKRFSNSLFVILVFMAYSFFTAPGALSWNRYYLQWVIPFLLFLYVKLLRTKYFRRSAVSVILALSSGINLASFTSFSYRFSNFDYFVTQNSWNIGRDNIQPKNVIWPATYYEANLGKNKNLDMNSKCLIVGNFWSAVPETLSGYSAKTVFELQRKYELNRKTLDELMFYENKSKEIDLKNIECLFLIAAVNKNQLLDFLLKNGWISRNLNGPGSNYDFYILQKTGPAE